MANYTPRLTAPTKDNAHYYANNPCYQSGYGLPNSTCYAWGRFYEVSGERPLLSLGNAENWWSYSDGYKRGSTPKLGAVICWRKGQAHNGADGAGHVAIVEAINDDGSIVTSESGWNSSLFWTSNRTNSNGNWGQSSAYTFQGFIYNPKTFDGTDSGGTEHSRYIWDYFVEKIGNEYGVAGLMGNLEAESGLYPDRVQGDIPYSDYSKNYTADVDAGRISESDFVHNAPNGGGYGLAQWTYYTRKQRMYDMFKAGGYSSIGSIELACDYLWHELQNDFAGVLSVLRSAKSVREASDKVLHDFENPADQSVSVEIRRASMGQAWFELYSGTKPAAKRKGLPLLLMWAATRR